MLFYVLGNVETEDEIVSYLVSVTAETQDEATDIVEKGIEDKSFILFCFGVDLEYETLTYLVITPEQIKSFN
jgi:hypothetical protein